MTLYKNARIESENEEDDILREQQDSIEEAESQKGAKSPDGHDWADRYANLMREFQRSQARHKDEMKSLETKMEKISTGEIRPPKSETEIIEWEKEYPDFAQIMDARVERIVESKIKDVKAQTNEVKKDKALLSLKKAVARDHPDVDLDGILGDTVFHEWLKKQSELTQKAIYKSLNVDDAADVIDKYITKVLVKKNPKDNEDYGNAAKAVRTRSTPDVSNKDNGEYEYSESQIEAMDKKDPKWWDTNGEKVMNAMRRGKVLMDITAGAR